MKIDCNSWLAKKTLNIWKKNSKKVYFYEKDKSFKASNLLDKIETLDKKINKKYYKKSVVFMNGNNTVDWICAYLTFKINNFYIVIIPSSITRSGYKYLLNLIKPNIIFQNNKLKFYSKKSTLLNLLKEKNITIKPNSSYEFLFTTGTTSFPKGVCIPEASFLETSKNLIKILKQSINDTELLSMSFSHSFGLTRLRTCLINGQKIYVSDGLKNFPEVYNNLIKYNITGLSLVPSAIEIIKLMLKKKIKNISPQIKYFEIGSSTLNLNSRKWLKRNFKKTIVQHHFGSTEASRSFFAARGNKDNLDIKDNWIGKKAKYIKFKLIDPKTNKINKCFGEIVISGKNLASGYFCGESVYEKLFIKDYFKTSDIATYKNNLLYFLGKKNSIINVGGEKILPNEIEDRIEQIKKVKISLCGAVKDKIFGERVSALVVLNKNTSKNRDYVLSEINDKFLNEPFFKRPKTIKFCNNIKISNNGKKKRDNNYFKKLLKNK